MNYSECEKHGEVTGWELVISFVMYQGRRHKSVEMAVLSCGCQVLQPEVDARTGEPGMLYFELRDGVTGEVRLCWIESEEEYA